MEIKAIIIIDIVWIYLVCSNNDFEYFFFFRITSVTNKKVQGLVMQAVVDDNKGAENCPWSPAQLRGNIMFNVF